MARLYLDHNVSQEVVPLLRHRGHDIVTTGDLRLDRAEDSVQLLTAAEQGRPFITHNWRDFKLLHYAWRDWSAAWSVVRSHPGILVIPQRPHWSDTRAADEVTRFLGLGQPLENTLYRWQPASDWRQYH